MTIKELREEKGLSQKAFAESIGMKTPTIGGYENGRIKPSEAVLAKIKEVYGVDVATLAEQASPAEGVKPTKRTSRKKDEAVPAAPAKRTRKKATPTVVEEVGSAPVPAEEAKLKKRGGRKKATPVVEEKVEDAPVIEEAVEVTPVAEEKKPAPKKGGRKKAEAEQPAPQKRGGRKKATPVESAPAVDEKKPAKRGKKAEAAPKKNAGMTVVIQSPLGGSITPEEILKKTGPVDAVYVRVDENKAYWVRGDETGSVELW